MTGEIISSAAAVLVNAAFIGANLSIHRWESRQAWFVERRRELADPPILGPFGYSSGRYGNPIALTALNVGVALTFLNQLCFEPWMVPCVLVGPAAATGYFVHCRKIGKVDWTFLGDRLTLGGKLHLVHIAVEVGAAVLGIGLAVAYGLNLPIIAAIAGGALYLALVAFDIRSGLHQRPGLSG